MSGTATDTQGAATETAAEGITAAATADTTQDTQKQDSQPETGAKEEQAKTEPAEKDAGEAETDAAKKEADPESQPIADWSKVDLGLPKDAPVDANLLQSFGELAVKEGLTPAQAKATVNWQLAAIKEAQETYIAVQEKELKAAWGKNIAANQEKVIALASRIDRMKGCENFSKALAQSGAANNALVCKGLLAIANLLEEDGLNSGSQSGGDTREETALEGIEAAFAEARAGK